MTAGAMARTGLDETVLTELAQRFYGRISADCVRGPIFADRITNWDPVEKIVAIWSSAALMTGRYHGAPVPTDAGLPVRWEHFARWFKVFEKTTREVCSSEGAEHVIERARRIARSLHLAAADDRIAAGVPRRGWAVQVT